MLCLIMDEAETSLLVFAGQKPHLSLKAHHAMTQSLQWSDPHQLSLQLQSLPLDRYGGDSLLVGLPLQQIHYQTLNLPQGLAAQEVEAYCQLKLSQVLQVPIESLFLDYYLVDGNTAFVVSCAQSLIQGVQACGEAMQLHLKRVDINFYALLTALMKDMDPLPSLRALIIHGQNRLDFMEFHQQQLQRHQCLPFSPTEPMTADTLVSAWQSFSSQPLSSVLYVASEPQSVLLPEPSVLIATELLPAELQQASIDGLHSLTAYGLMLRHGHAAF